jgi:hypothetical protein
VFKRGVEGKEHTQCLLEEWRRENSSILLLEGTVKCLLEIKNGAARPFPVNGLLLISKWNTLNTYFSLSL